CWKNGRSRAERLQGKRTVSAYTGRRLTDMRLSTTINFFLYKDDGSYQAYREDLQHYAALGYKALDAIFCSATEPYSPLRTSGWMDWAKEMREEAERLGITFVQTHLPFYNFCDPVTGVIADTEEILEKAICCTKILGAR